jgi:hypothetical protein
MSDEQKDHRANECDHQLDEEATGRMDPVKRATINHRSQPHQANNNVTDTAESATTDYHPGQGPGDQPLVGTSPKTFLVTKYFCARCASFCGTGDSNQLARDTDDCTGMDDTGLEVVRPVSNMLFRLGVVRATAGHRHLRGRRVGGYHPALRRDAVANLSGVRHLEGGMPLVGRALGGGIAHTVGSLADYLSGGVLVLVGATYGGLMTMTMKSPRRDD